MTEAMVCEMIWKCYLAEGATRLLKDDEVLAQPKKEEVMVFRDLFQAGLYFPPGPCPRGDSSGLRHIPASADIRLNCSAEPVLVANEDLQVCSFN